MSENRRIVMAFGTFDLLHPGHEYVFTEAKKYGNYLIVVLARDSTVRQVKKKKPFYSQEIRKKNLEKNKWIDEVVLGDENDKYTAIKKYKPDTIVLGYDQSYFLSGLKDFPVQIVRLKAHKPEIYKSSIIRKKLGI